MARETKAERTARMARLRTMLQQAQEAAEIPTKLMDVLERACKVNFEITVAGGKFVVEDRDDRREFPAKMLPTFTEQSQEELDDLERRVWWKEEELREAQLREAQRKAELKSAALAKLSAEEREVLGL